MEDGQIKDAWLYYKLIIQPSSKASLNPAPTFRPSSAPPPPLPKMALLLQKLMQSVQRLVRTSTVHTAEVLQSKYQLPMSNRR